MQDIKNNNSPINIPIPEYGDLVYYKDRFGKLCYKLDASINDGGEGKIYSGTGGKVYKIYKPHRLTELTIEKIKAMVEKKPELSENICWPEALIFEPSESRIPVGFAMKNANAEAADIPTLEQLINNPGYHKAEWNRKDLVRVCIKMVELFEQLHKFDILMGDVNPKNILVDKYRNVLFIDVDSYQFDGFLCPVGMPEYVSARIHNMGGAFSEIERTLEDEMFAIITLIYRVLFLNALPFPLDAVSVKDAIINHRFRFGEDKNTGDDYYIWKNLTPTLRKIFIDAYIKGVYANEKTLISALRELYDDMEKGIVSDDLLLVDYIPNENIGKQRYVSVTCSECGGSFKKIDATKSELLCQQCIKIRKYNREIIYRFTCKKCGKDFTVNPWDSNNANSETALCPDCDENAVFPEKDFKRLEKLKAQYSLVLKNLSNNDKEDYF